MSQVRELCAGKRLLRRVEVEPHQVLISDEPRDSFVVVAGNLDDLATRRDPEPTARLAAMPTGDEVLLLIINRDRFAQAVLADAFHQPDDSLLDHGKAGGGRVHRQGEVCQLKSGGKMDVTRAVEIGATQSASTVSWRFSVMWRASRKVRARTSLASSSRR